MRWRAASALAAIGLVSMLGQVALLRELAVASFGIELVFLAGTAWPSWPKSRNGPILPR